MSRAETNKAIIRDLTEAIWNRRELHRVAEFYAEDYVADYRPYSEPKSGHAAIIGMVERVHAAFTGYHAALHDLLAEGDRVVARFTISGIQTGVVDNLSTLRQLGVMPTPAKPAPG